MGLEDGFEPRISAGPAQFVKLRDGSDEMETAGAPGTIDLVGPSVR
jgi:hypothetical protein